MSKYSNKTDTIELCWHGDCYSDNSIFDGVEIRLLSKVYNMFICNYSTLFQDAFYRTNSYWDIHRVIFIHKLYYLRSNTLACDLL